MVASTVDSIDGEDEIQDQIERIKVLRQIGKGAFSTVHLAQHITLFEDHTGTQPHLKLALKIMRKSQIQELNLYEKVKQEINSLKECNHPHIVKLYKVIDTPQHVILVNDYLNAGELHDYMLERMKGEHKSLPRNEARRYFQEIASAVGYLHDKKICHRDLKLENVLLYRDHTTKQQFIKVADFGFSHVLDGKRLTTACGSPFFAAPEIVSSEAYFGDSADAWACGVILYVMVCGKLPFQENNMKMMYAKIRRGDYVLPKHLNREEKELIVGMMKVDPVDRMDMLRVRNSKYCQRSLPHYLKAHRLERRPTDIDGEVIFERNYIERKSVSNRIGQMLKASKDPIYRNISVETVERIVMNENNHVDSRIDAAKPFETNHMKPDNDAEDYDDEDVNISLEVAQDIILVYKMCLEEMLISQRIVEMMTRNTMWTRIFFMAIVVIVVFILLVPEMRKSGG